MRPVLLVVLASFFVFVSPAGAQQESSSMPEWEVKAFMSGLQKDFQAFLPLLQKIDNARWTRQGAPSAYAKQVKSANAAVQVLIAEADKVAAQPAKVTSTLAMFFQLEQTNFVITSLNDGVRKYQSTELADEINNQLSATASYLDRVRQHLTELAAVREQDLATIDQEAQRCRAALAKTVLIKKETK